MARVCECGNFCVFRTEVERAKETGDFLVGETGHGVKSTLVAERCLKNTEGRKKEEESALLLFITANEKATKISDGKSGVKKLSAATATDGRGRSASDE